jgi:hypothetical protein
MHWTNRRRWRAFVYRRPMKNLCLACLLLAVPALTLVACTDDTTSTSDASIDASSNPTTDAQPLRDATVPPKTDGGTPVLPLPPPGACTFSVDGTMFASAAGDPFTTAVLSGDSLTVQCVAVVGDVRHTVNLAAAGVSGPGTSKPGLGQYSTQPATGGTATQFRAFDAVMSVASTTPTLSGTSSFKATGSETKMVTVAFNLTVN